jgi:D-glycero-D-manno-heptose 1,7-bisphosphate phosphatase
VNRAIFLDRDGTLLVEIGYLNHPSLVAPYHFTLEALRQARSAGFLLIAVTNQSGIARGYLTEPGLSQIHDRMQGVFADHGVELDAVYYCPHHPEGTVSEYTMECSCRKPGPDLGLRAARRFGISLDQSYVIGDKETDLLFGDALGATSCLVRTGFGKSEEPGIAAEDRRYEVFDNVLGAVSWITKGGRT